MQRTETVAAAVLSLVVASVSMLLVSYGTVIVLSEDVPVWIQLFAFTVIAYGVGIWAWFGGGTMAVRITKIASIAIFVIYVVASMDVGMISGLEVAGILGLGLLLWCNWFSVRYVARRRSHA